MKKIMFINLWIFFILFLVSCNATDVIVAENNRVMDLEYKGLTYYLYEDYIPDWDFCGLTSEYIYKFYQHFKIFGEKEMLDIKVYDFNGLSWNNAVLYDVYKMKNDQKANILFIVNNGYIVELFSEDFKYPNPLDFTNIIGVCVGISELEKNKTNELYCYQEDVEIGNVNYVEKEIEIIDICDVFTPTNIIYDWKKLKIEPMHYVGQLHFKVKYFEHLAFLPCTIYLNNDNLLVNFECELINSTLYEQLNSSGSQCFFKINSDYKDMVLEMLEEVNKNA